MTKSVFLKTKDFSVSSEEFELHHNLEFDMLETFPKPEAADLSRYYASDDYISHTNSKRTLFEKAYHIARSFAIRNKLRLLNSVKTSGDLLDIGAGTGDFLDSANKRGWIVTGVEPSSNARQIAVGKGLKILGDTTELADKSFDIITMWHVLEHVPDPVAQIAELRRLLRPGGYIIIAVPNFKSHDALYYGSYWAAYDVPRHLWHFSQTSIAKLFAGSDFTVSKVLPMLLDSFYVSLLSEKYKHGRSNPVKAFKIGLESNIKARKTGEYSSLIYLIK